MCEQTYGILRKTDFLFTLSDDSISISKWKTGKLKHKKNKLQ